MDNNFKTPVVTSTREMLGMPLDEIDLETLSDGVGEMANIVASNVKAALSESHLSLQLTLPVVSVAAAAASEESGKRRCRFHTEVGGGDLIFWLSESNE